jgi:hypothetical protein
MTSIALVEIEKQISCLSASEQWRLAEQILQNLRNKAEQAKQEAELAAMAADPNIQREIHQIQKEFAVADADGLEGL